MECCTYFFCTLHRYNQSIQRLPKRTPTSSLHLEMRSNFAKGFNRMNTIPQSDVFEVSEPRQDVRHYEFIISIVFLFFPDDFA